MDNQQHGDIYAPSLGQRSAYTDFIVQLLRDAPTAAVVTFDEIAQVTGLKKKQYLQYLYSAIKIVETDHGKVFRSVRNVGYQHVKENEVPTYATRKHVSQLRGNARRFRSKLDTVDPSKLTPDERIEHTVAIMNVSLMEDIADKKTQKQIRKKATRNPLDGYPVGNFLEALKTFK